MFRHKSLLFRSSQCRDTCQNHFACYIDLYWLHPSGVSIDGVENHLTCVVPAGAMQELASLVSVDDFVGFICGYGNVLLLDFWLVIGVWNFGGASAGPAWDFTFCLRFITHRNKQNGVRFL